MPLSEDLSALAKLEAGATKGPWKIRARPSLTQNPDVGNDTDSVATVWQAGMLVDGHRPHNAAFIIAARNFLAANLPELTALVALRERLAEAEREIIRRTHYAAYCKCCAESGEHSLHDYDAFLARTRWPWESQSAAEREENRQ